MGFESILAAGKACTGRTEAIPPMTKARLIDDVKPIAGVGGREWTVLVSTRDSYEFHHTTARRREAHRDVQQLANDERSSQIW